MAPSDVRTLAASFVARGTYKHYRFDKFNKDTIVLERFSHNLRKETPANNHMSEHYGDAVHGYSIRLVVIRFLIEHTDIRGVKMACAIEWLVCIFTKNEYMSRLFASAGVDFETIQVAPGDEAEIRKWLKTLTYPAPKLLANIMEAVAWAVISSAGWRELADHYYAHLITPMRQAMKPFRTKWDKSGSLYFFSEAEVRWFKHHNQHAIPSHVATFIKSTASLSLDNLFYPLKRVLSDEPLEFAPNGSLTFRSLSLAYCGFALLDLLWRKEIDRQNSLYRASVSGGSHLATVMRRMALCDESLAFIANGIGLLDFPETANAHTKAQSLSAAAEKLHNQDPAYAEFILCRALGVLVGIAQEIAFDFEPSLKPVMPSNAPYSISPPSMKRSKASSSLAEPREILYPTTTESSSGPRRSSSTSRSGAHCTSYEPAASLSHGSVSSMEATSILSRYEPDRSSSHSKVDTLTSLKSTGSHVFSSFSRLFRLETHQKASQKLKGKQRAP
ncbi:hypothetical protein ONZ45_g6207 [Pleurotus djamor]|nr:hypothetical protein ONZ45_g6207 [Pleurotus djamor]